MARAFLFSSRVFTISYERNKYFNPYRPTKHDQPNIVKKKGASVCTPVTGCSTWKAHPVNRGAVSLSRGISTHTARKINHVRDSITSYPSTHTYCYTYIHTYTYVLVYVLPTHPYNYGHISFTYLVLPSHFVRQSTQSAVLHSDRSKNKHI